MPWLARILSRLRPAPPRIEPGEDVVLVDVRTAPEFRAGHARGALHIPFNQMEQRYHELDPHRDRRILLYCLSGTRAAAAERVLREHGFPHVENARTLGAVRRAGVEVQRGE